MSNKKLFRVWSSNWAENVNVEDFFEDPFTEACTRCVEQKLNESDSEIKITPIIMCKCISSNQQITLNTYKVLINGGFYQQAEHLRKSFINMAEIDLATEPLSSSIKTY